MLESCFTSNVKFDISFLTQFKLLQHYLKPLLGLYSTRHCSAQSLKPFSFLLELWKSLVKTTDYTSLIFFLIFKKIKQSQHLISSMPFFYFNFLVFLLLLPSDFFFCYFINDWFFPWFAFLKISSVFSNPFQPHEMFLMCPTHHTIYKAFTVHFPYITSSYINFAYALRIYEPQLYFLLLSF